eukprot:scaffold46483_cov69-Phaeocystis_antarctica.AAC.1
MGPMIMPPPMPSMPDITPAPTWARFRVVLTYTYLPGPTPTRTARRAHGSSPPRAHEGVGSACCQRAR